MTAPDFTYERSLLNQGLTRIAGVDEVGRGPLAGPVTAAAVILNPDCIPDGLNDSKKLSAKRREALAVKIAQTALVAVVHVSVEQIEQLNILRAAQLAMAQAVARLDAQFALIDGGHLPRKLSCPAKAIVRGDAKVLSIAAASIMAKVARDALMVDLAQQHPGYGWETNAGYPTTVHLKALQELGVTPHHRRSFKPVHNILYQD